MAGANSQVAAAQRAASIITQVRACAAATRRLGRLRLSSALPGDVCPQGSAYDQAQQEERVPDQHPHAVAVPGWWAVERTLQSRLNRPLRMQLEKKGTINNELAVVISSIAVACKQIANLVNRAGISNLTGLAGAANIQVRTCPMALHGSCMHAVCTPGRVPSPHAPFFSPQLHSHWQGEDQKKLDVVSNEVFKNCLAACGRTGVLASEEEDFPMAVDVADAYSGEHFL